jgi:hypothetical protein
MRGMTDLKWRTVAELRLVDLLVPSPTSSHMLLRDLSSVRVAIEGNMLHIDPRPTNSVVPVDQSAPFTVTVVPTSQVEYIRYQVAPAEPYVYTA